MEAILGSIDIKTALLAFGFLATVIGIVASIYKIRESRYKIKESKKNLTKEGPAQVETQTMNTPSANIEASGINIPNYGQIKTKEDLKKIKKQIPKADYKFLKKKLSD